MKNKENPAPEAMSGKLTPNEIKNKEFKKTMLGYTPQEVVDFLDSVAKVWEKVQKNEKELLARIESLQATIKTWESREQELEKVREIAVHDAESIRKEAVNEAERIFLEVEERANGIRTKTEQWLETVIAKVEEAERQKNNFMKAFRSALDSHYELLRNEEAEAESMGAKLNHFLKTEIGTSQQPM